MMNARKHVELLAYSLVTWLTFYILGLPEYYQQWYLWAKIVIVLLVTAMYFSGDALYAGTLLDQRSVYREFVLARTLSDRSVVRLRLHSPGPGIRDWGSAS